MTAAHTDAPHDAVTFINRFAVHSSADEFEAAFARTAAFLAGQEGFIDYTLLRSDDSDQHYVNVARWDSVALFRRALAHSDFSEHAAALRAVSTSQPQLYTVRQSLSRPRSEHHEP
jgi:deoxynogalonate / 12-deoxyaklanonic acid monooxygenase